MNVFYLGSFSEHIRSIDLFSKRFRSVGFCSERSFDRIFLFLLVFGQGSICEYFIYSLVPGFQTSTSFTPVVQIQRNQRPRLRYNLLYPVKQLKHVFDKFKI